MKWNESDRAEMEHDLNNLQIRGEYHKRVEQLLLSSVGNINEDDYDIQLERIQSRTTKR